MPNKKLITLLAISLLLPSLGQSQVFSAKRLKERVKNRAETRTEQKINNKVDKGVDKVFDSLFGTIEKNTNKGEKASQEAADSKSRPNSDQEATMGLFKNLMGGMGGSSPAESYTFDASFKMKMTIEEKGKEQSFGYKYYFSKNNNYMATKITNATDPKMAKQLQSMEAMIFDFDKNSFFSFMNMNGQKQMIGMKIPDASGKVLEDSYEKIKYTKTSQTKNIIGYTCDGYLMEQDGEKYLVWISQKAVSFIPKYYDLFNKMAKSPNSNAMAYDVNPELKAIIESGRMMMGMNMTDKKGNKSSMELVEINANDTFNFSTGDYSNMMDMNAIMKQAQE